MPLASTSYDALPYLSLAYPHAHPERMATTATLYGLKPASIDTCRVLEIGCASGGNLVPLAEQFPKASFVGIDLSSRQISEGQAFIQRAELGNVGLKHANILDAPEDLGMFDYIICRGLYSQTSVDVQEKILEFSKGHLNPEGIAYISYNTLPGSRTRELLRDMTLFHLRQYPEAAEQVRRARGVLDFFAKSIDTTNNPHGAQLLAEIEGFRRSPDSFLAHDLLDKQNVPIYFFEFNRRAEANGLRFLAEADGKLFSSVPPPKEAREILQRFAPSPTYLEQFFDFLRNRPFRQSLLCHADRQPATVLRPEILSNMYVAAPVRPKSETPDFQSEQPETFVCDSGTTFTSQGPIVKSALLVLGEEYPRRLPFHVLRQRARARFDPTPILGGAAAMNDAQNLGLALLQCATMGGSDVVELSIRSLPVATAAAERPRTTKLNLLLAAASKPIVSLRHESLFLGPFENHLIRLLDGTRDRNGIREALVQLVRDKVLNLQKDGAPVTDETQITAILDETINQQLTILARRSMLVEDAPAS